MTDPLSPDSLHIILRNIIASDASTSTSSSSNSANDATLSNATSLIAALAHSIHTSLGFRQIRPKPQGEERESSVDPLIRNRLSSEWWKRCSEDESFEFQYRHDQSSLIFQIRISRLGGRTVVNAVAVEDDKTATLDITTNDYTSSSNFPKPFSDLTEDVNTLKTLFNSSARLADLITAYKVQIIQKLLPGLTKAGYSEASSTDNGNNGGTAPPPPPAGGPSVPRGGGGVPLRPDNEIDPGRIGAPPQFPRAGLGQNPLEIGRSDLDPLGGQVGRLPGAGGDGMFVGPNHPLFGREQGQVNPLGGAPQRGPWGGDGFLPPLGAPPGARFDPITPFGQGGGVGGGIGGQPGRNWGDEMPPPGFDNDPNAGNFNPLNPGGGGGFGGPRGGFPPRGGPGGFGGGGGFGNMYL